MSQEREKNPKMSSKEMQRVLSAPEGKELLTLLRESGCMEAAMEAFKKGDMKGVQAALQPVMETERAEGLLRKINGK